MSINVFTAIGRSEQVVAQHPDYASSGIEHHRNRNDTLSLIHLGYKSVRAYKAGLPNTKGPRLAG